MRLVILESPFAANTEMEKGRNVDYARECLKDSLYRGEAPIASHLLYTQVLDDDDPEERNLGIEAGLAWMGMAEKMVVYTDRGVSAGMKDAIDSAEGDGIKVEYRSIKCS